MGNQPAVKRLKSPLGGVSLVMAASTSIQAWPFCFRQNVFTASVLPNQSLSLLVGGRSRKEMRDRIRRVWSSDSFVGFEQQWDCGLKFSNLPRGCRLKPKGGSHEETEVRKWWKMDVPNKDWRIWRIDGYGQFQCRICRRRCASGPSVVSHNQNIQQWLPRMLHLVRSCVWWRGQDRNLSEGEPPGWIWWSFPLWVPSGSDRKGPWVHLLVTWAAMSAEMASECLAADLRSEQVCEWSWSSLYPRLHPWHMMCINVSTTLRSGYSCR